MGSTYLKPHQKRGYKLVNLKKADVFADTRPCSSAKLKHGRLHLLQLLLARLEPPFGPVCIDVVAKDLRTSVQNPSVASDNGATGDVFAQNVDTLRWNDALQEKAGGGIETEGLLDDGIEVGEILAFAPCDKTLLSVCDQAALHGFIELGHEFPIDGGVS